MEPGELLGDRYRLIAPLGAGGTAVVWRATDEVLDRAVAVKLLATRAAGDAAVVGRLRAEAQAAARLHHPHVVAVHDFGEAARPAGPPVPYVVLELVEGRCLSEVLADGPLPWRDAVRIAAEVAAALAAAHARGIVHRDVKPENVMLTTDGAKLVDFGISATIGEVDTGPGGELLCTPAYLAPERLQTGPVRAACDLYGLGLLLYKSLTGEFPWRWERTSELLAAHRHIAPAPLPPVSGLPPEVAALCQRCLAKRPGDRPRSAEAARVLAVAAAGAGNIVGSVAAPARAAVPEPALTKVEHRTSRLRSRRRRMLAVAVAVVVLAGVAVGSRAAGGWSTPEPTQGLAQQLARQAVACQVRYDVRENSGDEFAAGITLTNTGAEPLTDWQLAFALPADHELVWSSAARWQQTGQSVAVHGAGPAATLPTGRSVVLGLEGSYQGVARLPTGFRLNGTECAQVRAAATGAADPRPGESRSGEAARVAGDRGGGHGPSNGIRGNGNGGDSGNGGGGNGNRGNGNGRR
jgi:serine/threonine-protein kinase